MKTQTIKACSYIRVSTEHQAKEGESLSIQRDETTRQCELKGWTLTQVYEDGGRSGESIEGRPAMQHLLDDARQGEFQYVVVKKLDRLSRSLYDMLTIERELRRCGVQLLSIVDSVDTGTPTGRMIFNTLGSFAEYEWELIRTRTSEGRARAWRDGNAFIGRPPFGYEWNGSELTVNSTEAELYRRIVTMYVDQGLSYNDITVQLNREGLFCKSSRTKKDGTLSKPVPWSPSAVKAILKNTAYYGHYVVNQYQYESYYDKAGNKRWRRGALKPTEEHITVNVTPLISKTRWDQIQDSITFKTHKSKRNDATGEFYLRDVLVCGSCGGTMKPKLGKPRRDGTRERYYHCFWSGVSKKTLEANKHHKCSLPFVKARDVEAAVFADIMVLFALNPRRAFSRLFDTGRHQARIEHLKDSIERMETTLRSYNRVKDNLYKLLEDPELDLEDLRRKLKVNRDDILRTEGDLQQLHRQLEELETLQTKEKQLSEYYTKNKTKLAQLRKDIRNLSLEDRKLLCEGMLDGKVRFDVDTDPESEGYKGFGAGV